MPPEQRYLAAYEAEDAEVFGDEVYLARLNDPTAWTRRAMSDHVIGLTRTVCRVCAGRGTGLGGWNGVVILDALHEQSGAAEIENALLRRGIVGAYLLEATAIGQAPTSERAEREAKGAADQVFPGALLLEGTDEAPVRAATDAVAARLATRTAGVYRIQHVLTSDGAAGR